MRKLSALIGVSALVVALASACGVSVGPDQSLSGPSLAREISSQLAHDYPIHGEPVVSCPDGIRATKGTTFVCTTVLDGQPLDLDGTVTGPNGRYRVVPRDPVIPISVLENVLTTDIAKQTETSPSKVDCGSRLVAVVAVGGTITCWATFPLVPAPREIVSTVQKDGSVSWTFSE